MSGPRRIRTSSLHRAMMVSCHSTSGPQFEVDQEGFEPPATLVANEVLYQTELSARNSAY
jgi:hypothetical protein